MFTFLSRFRRQTAVLTALALVASVLVTVPVSAADDPPKADYKAVLDNCAGVPSSGFEDVLSGHTNAGDIDCIAYYGITRGTSATTYSPLMSVTREHMALFLTRLAGIVGIEMTDTPDDPGFTDTGDLPDSSRLAIAQLADLGIARGTSETTFSPGDSVRRDHMALFISRLMDKMTPTKDGDTIYGYLPKDVKGTEDMPVLSPFTDLGSTTKSAYDAITALWELGIASGISDTAYGPSTLITRAAMAEFMAGVLDHSNARPAGISIQAITPEAFGDIATAAGSTKGMIVVSYRDENFAPMPDVSVAVFNSGDVGELDDGKCATAVASQCAWDENQNPTDNSGNIFEDGAIALTDNAAASETWYAWVGDEDTTMFDTAVSKYASVKISAKSDALGMNITPDTPRNSTTANLATDSSVTLTVQLIDIATTDSSTATDVENAEDVMKPEVEITIGLQQGDANLYPPPDAIKTDDKGQITFTISAPKDNEDNDAQTRTDIVSFDIDDGDETTTNDPARQISIVWAEDAVGAATTGMVTVPEYGIRNDDGEVTFRATVNFYDKYGNAAGSRQRITFTGVGSPDPAATIKSNGSASILVKELATTIGTNIDVDVDVGTTGLPDATADSLTPVNAATKRDVAATATNVDGVYEDDDAFRLGSTLYNYDSNDTYLLGGRTIDMDKFETEIQRSGAQVQVVAYSSNSDVKSIFISSNTS